MKPVWVGIVFFLVYGFFSMKSQAAELPAKHLVLAEGECQ